MARDTDLRARLAEHGNRRRAALEQASAELDAIAELAPAALAAGITKVEIAKLGGVSRPTLDAKLNA